MSGTHDSSAWRLSSAVFMLFVALAFVGSTAQAQTDQELAARLSGEQVRLVHDRTRGPSSSPGVRHVRVFSTTHDAFVAVVTYVGSDRRQWRGAVSIGGCADFRGARVLDFDLGPGLLVLELECALGGLRSYLHFDRQRGLRRVLGHRSDTAHIGRVEAEWDEASSALRITTERRIPRGDPHAGWLAPEAEVEVHPWTGHGFLPPRSPP